MSTGHLVPLSDKHGAKWRERTMLAIHKLDDFFMVMTG